MLILKIVIMSVVIIAKLVLAYNLYQYTRIK